MYGNKRHFQYHADNQNYQDGIPNRIRTGVTRMRTWCPRPLDDEDALKIKRHNIAGFPLYQNINRKIDTGICKKHYCHFT